MKNIIKSGFTLIELLVVITIIGILATGGISVYTAQIQKARDTTRITDIKVLQGGVEQAYQDNSYYPLQTEFLNGDAANGITGIRSYLEDIPSDSKTGQACNRDAGADILCGYAYMVQDSQTGISNGAFELSVAFENAANVTKKANNNTDTGNSNDTYELGIDKDVINSAYEAPDATTVYLPLEGACLADMTGGLGTDSAIGVPGDIIIITGSGSC